MCRSSSGVWERPSCWSADQHAAPSTCTPQFTATPTAHVPLPAPCSSKPPPLPQLAQLSLDWHLDIASYAAAAASGYHASAPHTLSRTRAGEPSKANLTSSRNRPTRTIVPGIPNSKPVTRPHARQFTFSRKRATKCKGSGLTGGAHRTLPALDA
jgi:hypothetical protein